MRRKDLILRLMQALTRRRTALQKTLSGNTQRLAVDGRSVGDTVDAAVDCEQDELDSQLAVVESRELAAIQAALDSIREGSYGICESCARPIPVARLKALPYATLCIRCQRKEEEKQDPSNGIDNDWELVIDQPLSDESKSIEAELV